MRRDPFPSTSCFRALPTQRPVPADFVPRPGFALPARHRESGRRLIAVALTAASMAAVLLSTWPELLTLTLTAVLGLVALALMLAGLALIAHAAIHRRAEKDEADG